MEQRAQECERDGERHLWVCERLEERHRATGDAVLAGQATGPRQGDERATGAPVLPSTSARAWRFAGAEVTASPRVRKPEGSIISMSDESLSDTVITGGAAPGSVFTGIEPANKL